MNIDWDILLRQMADRLEIHEPPSVTEVAARHRSSFKILIATMISLRTKDEVTSAASDRLFSIADSPNALVKISQKRIADLIYPAGFYRVKAGNLKEAARKIINEFDGKVPSGMEDLLSLPGVGRKTANLVRGLGFGIDAICVDTHVHRISNRLGWVKTDTPEQTEEALMKILPRKYWISINTILVAYGKRVCMPVSPKCSVCAVLSSCLQRGVDRSR